MGKADLAFANNDGWTLQSKRRQSWQDYSKEL